MADLIPSGAKLHARLSGGVHLLDVVDELPRGRARWSGRRPGGADAVRHLFAHHSGALGRPGFAGLLASANYVIRHRDFPTAAYAYWVPHHDVHDHDGNRIVFLCLRPEDRGWHTGRRANDTGEAVALQGNTSLLPLTAHHEECLEALFPWWAEQHDQPMEEAAAWLGWHAIGDRFGGRRKKQCPGSAGEAYVADYVRRATLEALPEAA
ncbi:MAG: N-acetylmuramoyl-L-alanine amidase [Myxococcota bacterium]